MGRGRQKAKQTKVARELKYHTQDTDYDALKRELTTGSAGTSPAPDILVKEVGEVADDEQDDGDYSRYLRDLNDDDYGPVSSRR